MVQSRQRSTDGLVNQVHSGQWDINAGNRMVLQQQYAAGTAIATSVVETSLFTAAKFVPASQGTSGGTPSTLVTIPSNFLAIGMLYRGTIVGTIANTSTPNLRTRVVLRDTAGAIAYTLSDTTATAMSTVSASDFEVNFDAMVADVGATGSIVGRISHRYGTVLVPAVPAAVTVDTTAQYTIDVLLTWGTSSSSNTATVLWSVVELE